MRILLMGPQGSGKGTVGKLLSEELGIPIISPGKLMREMPKDDPDYNTAQDAMNEGVLVPHEIPARLLKKETNEIFDTTGFILDGWMRSHEEIDYFDPQPDVAIHIDIPRETSLKRISGRRICKNCGASFNVYTLPPKEEGICDVCGSELSQRSDDTEEAVNKRLDIYDQLTKPVVEEFRKQGKLLEVDGGPLPEEVFKSILDGLKEMNLV